MKPVTAAVLGAGGRGKYAYAAYALRHPEELRIVGVAEPDDMRRSHIVKEHGIAGELTFSDWRDLLSKPRCADLICICTPDHMHVEPAVAAMQRGYHILLEKPIAPSAEECLFLEREAKKNDASVAVAHVLRYTPFFQVMKRLINDGAIGRIRGIVHNENIGHIHFSHSFVRGNWRNTRTAAPMILAKSCHDMDILLYLLGADCTAIASFGSRGTFSTENKPADAPSRCLDGCPYSATCPYYGPKIYMQGNTDWPVNALTEDLTPSGILRALQEGPYGRCVYACDNNMTEHQVVNFRFEDGVTATFTMSAFTREMSRTIKVVGEEGEIRGAMETGEIAVFDFSTRNTEVISLRELTLKGRHSGGDDGFMRNLIRHLRWPATYPPETPLGSAIPSHVMAFAAEESMNNGEIIIMDDYKKGIYDAGGSRCMEQ